MGDEKEEGIRMGFHIEGEDRMNEVKMDNEGNIILIGLMGSGKTSVGRALAKRLLLRWVDTDAEIERITGKRIPDIFQEEGEERFRDIESQILFTLLKSRGQVISTGGGIVLRKENVEAMRAAAFVVYLRVSLSELMHRLKGSDRPLLKGDEEKRIGEIWERRRGMYDFAHLHIDTTERSIEEVVEEILPYLSR